MIVQINYHFVDDEIKVLVDKAVVLGFKKNSEKGWSKKEKREAVVYVCKVVIKELIKDIAS